jgi:LysM repeat protein
MEIPRRNYTFIIFSFLFALLLLPSHDVHAQKERNAGFQAYIDKYSDVAVSQMKKYKIPASITLAQGLLESGAGRSELTRKSNNHFGIKCGSSWRGKTVRHDDDARNECFRVYKHANESYEDHSLFLSRGTRYAFLFKLTLTDYKGWARGLKKAGYATDPSYANRLITIIEDYELYKYDRKRGKGSSAAPVLQRQVYLSNDLAYIIARDGDTFKSLAKETGIGWRKLIKYNDLHKEYTLADKDIIYLCRKNKKAAKTYTVHIIRDGDSMHSISQMYGVRLKNLYKMNRKDPDYIPEVGQHLRLR